MKTVKECRAVLSDLISEAIPEKDDARREGLLTLADGWVDLIEKRKATDEEGTPDDDDDPAA